MSILTKESNKQNNNSQNSSSNIRANDELTIHLTSTVNHPSGMSQTSKTEAREDAPSLYELFEQVLKDKGEEGDISREWKDENELEVQGLSRLTLHRFVLEAEKLGKNVQFVKTLTVKISD